MKFQGRARSRIPLESYIYIFLILCIIAFCVYSQFYYGLFILVIVPLLFRESGVQFKDDQYYEFTSILGIQFGKWKKLPPVLYILIKDTRFLSQESDYDNDDGNITTDTYEVALVCEPRTKIILLYSPDTARAIKTVNMALEYFKCNLRDMTREQLMQTPEANW